VEVRPTTIRAVSYMWAIKRVTVVLPLVPVTAMIGMREGALSGYSMSMIGPPTSRPWPLVGARCILRPGAAFTSTWRRPAPEGGVGCRGR